MTQRILVIEGAHNIGGSLTSIEVVLRWGLRRGLQFDVMSAVDVRGYLPPEIGWFPMPAQTRYPIPKRKFIRLMVSQPLSVMRRLLQGRYDAMILNNAVNGNMLALATGWLARKPMLQFVRDFERDSRGWRLLQSKVDAFVAVSRAVQDDLRSRMRVAPERILLAPEGISERDPVTQEQRRALRTRFQLPQDAHVMGFVGRLDWWKGYELFVETAIQAALQNPRLHAIMVGGASAGQEERVSQLQRQIAEAGLSERVRMLGEVPPQQVEPLLRCMDVMVHTSVTPEPFGRVLLESMAIGVPVISSSEGGPREIIVDGESGYLTPPKDASALTNAVLQFFAEDGLAQAMGVRARERVQTHFNEAVCALPPLEWLRKQGINGSR